MVSRRYLLVLAGSAGAIAAAKGIAAQMLTQTNARKEMMNIKRSGSEPSAKGPAEYFTGSVRVDTLFRPQTGAHVRRVRDFRAWRAHRLAHASSRADAHYHRRLRSGAA